MSQLTLPEDMNQRPEHSVQIQSRKELGISTPKRYKIPPTPASRRLLPSTRKKRYKSYQEPEAPVFVASARGENVSLNKEQEEPGFEGLLKKQWRIYALSPLYKFKSHRSALIKCERSLDAALSQAQSTSADPLNSRPEKSSFSLYEDLRFHPDDPPALRVQVHARSEHNEMTNLVMEAFLVCVEPSASPFPENLQDHFTYYPVVLVAGNKARSTVLLEWLERHFDCRSDVLTLSDSDLKYMLVLSSAFMSGTKGPPVLLQYSIENMCEGITCINCKLEASYCKQLWQRLFSSSVEEKEELLKNEVDLYMDHVEKLLEHLMSIFFKKLNLSEVGTSAAYVSHLGKIKIFSPSAVYTALHHLCETANNRFIELMPRE